MSSASVGRPASAGDATGRVALREDPSGVATPNMELTYEHGVELEARSQWAYARMRFFRHKLAVTSLIILLGFGLMAIFASYIAPYGEDEIPLDDLINSLNRAPTFADWHIFGTVTLQ